METKQATPTPWKSQKAELMDTAGSYFWIESKKELVAKVYSKENAAYIVKAVNCHEELLEALKEIAEHQADSELDGRLVGIARSALAKAEGK